MSAPAPTRLPLLPPRPRASGTTDHEEATRYFREGAEAHAAGRLDAALAAFERARALAPEHPNAASACAAVLGEQGRHRAAWAALLPAGEALLRSADGAFNMGTTAEQCGMDAEAGAAYDRALQLNPDHVPALNNQAQRLVRTGHFTEALPALRRCTELAPRLPNLWAHWADALLASGDAPGALRALAQAGAHHPRDLLLAVRHAVAAACGSGGLANLATAQNRLRALPPAAGGLLQECLQASGLGRNGVTRQADGAPASAPPTRDAVLLLLRHAQRQGWDAERCRRLVEAACDALCRSAPAPGARSAEETAELLALAHCLPLPEALRQRLRMRLVPALPAPGEPPVRPFELSLRLHADGRLHIGLAVSEIASMDQARELAEVLRRHDGTRFVFHVYAASLPGDLARTTLLRNADIHVVELVHLRLAERIERIRLDGLDVLHDLCGGTPWCLPLGRWRMARVQLQHPAREALLPQDSWDYRLLRDGEPAPAEGAWLRGPAGLLGPAHDAAGWSRAWAWLAGRAHQQLPPMAFDATAPEAASPAA